MKNIISSKRFAFTLAEVLITLGIIGVVAAMTLPTLIANYKKQVVVSRMEKFYSTINQAIKRSEFDNESVKTWTSPALLDPKSLMEWWNKYMNNYFVSQDVAETSDGIVVGLADGSGFGIYNPTSSANPKFDWMHIVYCVKFVDCKAILKKSGNKIYGYRFDGKNTFLFNGDPMYNGVKPYGSGNSRDVLINGNTTYACAKSYKIFCAALIQYDGWKIEKDYPVKF